MQILQKSSYVVTAGSDSSSRNTSVYQHTTHFFQKQNNLLEIVVAQMQHTFLWGCQIYFMSTLLSILIHWKPLFHRIKSIVQQYHISVCCVLFVVVVSTNVLPKLIIQCVSYYTSSSVFKMQFLNIVIFNLVQLMCILV